MNGKYFRNINDYKGDSLIQELPKNGGYVMKVRNTFTWILLGLLVFLCHSLAFAADKTAPKVTAFTIPSTSTSLTVAITTFTASDRVGVTGYMATDSLAKPLASATGWRASGIGYSYTFAAAGTKKLYAWAKDAAGNVSASLNASVTITLPPCTYLISPTSSSPSASSGSYSFSLTEVGTCPWTASTTYSWIHTSSSGSASGTVNYTVDANTGTARTGTITVGVQTFTVNQAEGVRPLVTAFSVPSTAASLSVPITSFVATDNIGVTGYLVNESSANPSVTAGWGAAPPANYNATSSGTKMLYSWAKDAAGNVSNSKSASVTINAGLPGGFLWAEQAMAVSASYSATAFGVAVDAGGNAVVVGSFSGSLDFGCGMISSTSTSDIFVARYSSTGSCLWSKKLGSSSGTPATAYSVAVDGSGNIVVTGWFSGSLDFGGGSIASAGVDDIFIAKYSSTGAYLWAKRLGGLSNDHAYSITTDNNSNIIVTGYFAGTADFGGGSLTSAGGADIFIAKYLPTGAYMWAKRIGGSGSDIGWSVTTDSSDTIVVTGHFSGSVDFGGGLLTSAGGKDILVAKYSTNGAHIWSNSFGSPTDDCSYGVAVDGYGNVLLTGIFTGTIDFGGGPMSPAGGGDIYLAKYSSSGQYVWAKHFGSTSPNASLSYAVSVDESDNIVLTGVVIGNINFGSGWLFSNGSNDIFLAKFTSNGVNLWSKRFGTAYDDHGRAVAVDTYGNVFMVGDFFESVDFGGGTFTSAYTPDAFIAKFAP
jgi:hypothetical protein